MRWGGGRESEHMGVGGRDGPENRDRNGETQSPTNFSQRDKTEIDEG